MLLEDNKIHQRDAFWSKVYNLAKEDEDIVVVSADMGAPALDKFRKNLPGQFINAGIAEQNATTIAAGMSLMGKKVVTYAIAPFITLRCLEQIRVSNAIMNIPISIVGVGTGFGYDDSGPTHHLIEDIAIMRAMPNINIYSITDSIMAQSLAQVIQDRQKTNYLRIERKLGPNVYSANHDFSKGFEVLIESDIIMLMATGPMTWLAVQLAETLNKNGYQIGVTDIYRFPINSEQFSETIRGKRILISMEEHFLPGGLGSMISEIITDHQLDVRLKRTGLSHEQAYCYRYGGREEIWSYYKMGKEHLTEIIKKELQCESLSVR
jgi:transketolase